MLASAWLRKVFPGAFRTSRRAVKRRTTRLFNLESLEDRVVPANTITFSTPGQTFAALTDSNTITVHATNTSTGHARSNDTVTLTTSDGTGKFYKTDGVTQITSVTTDSSGNASFLYY